MNTQKLAKTLKKELTRNPKKSIALALVTVVALWMWGPLVWNYLGGKKKPAKPADGAIAQNAVPVAEPTGKPAAARPAPVRASVAWDKLLERLAHDELMRSAALPPQGRDPFRVTLKEQQVVESTPRPVGSTPGAVTARPPEFTPQTAGLVLEGTLISPRDRRAMISGKLYRVGDTIKPAKVDAPADVAVVPEVTPEATPAAEQAPVVGPKLEFQVKEIAPRHVVLARGDKTYELALVRESLTEDQKLSFGPQTDER